MWTEKYRPKSFDEVKGQEEIVKRVRAFVSQKNMPHILFSGPAGVGKTTLSLCVARELFGESYRENFLELNASDERGIDVVRVKVKDFARTRALGNVPFKIIYLDECDALTREAQQALRRTMENYTSTCRFILSCNYSSKIIDPIQSRCAIFRFKPLGENQIQEIINKVAANENLIIDEAGKHAIFVVSEGDCRRAENLLQACAAISNNITEEVVYSMASVARPKEIKDMLNLCVSKDFLNAKKTLIDTMLQYGLSGIDIIKQIQGQIWELEIDPKKRLDMIKQCGEVEFRLVEGSDEFIQLESLLSKFVLINC